MKKTKSEFSFRKTFIPLCTYATAGVEFGWQENQYDQKVDDVYSTTIESLLVGKERIDSIFNYRICPSFTCALATMKLGRMFDFPCKDSLHAIWSYIKWQHQGTQ